ncbi:GNAT family N-acetyltransferase [Gordonia sinesedis]
MIFATIVSMHPTIRAANLDDPAVRAFVEAHRTDIAPTAPDASQHALDVAGLRSADGARVWTAHVADGLAGIIALVPLEPGHAELKSMRTAPEYRGRGVGGALLRHALADAAHRGIGRVSLETGSMDFFAPARALYRRAGFIESAAFADYPADDPHSTYMTILLDQPPTGIA